MKTSRPERSCYPGTSHLFWLKRLSRVSLNGDPFLIITIRSGVSPEAHSGDSPVPFLHFVAQIQLIEYPFDIFSLVMGIRDSFSTAALATVDACRVLAGIAVSISMKLLCPHIFILLA